MVQERINQVVKGYELREQIGEGGYGVVYRAYQPLVGRDVAVKIILPQYANQADFIRRFESEAHLVARLEHPYIVPLYDYWREPDGAFLVMRWLRGGSLHSLLLNGPLPTELLDRMIDQVGGALATAHRRGVVHRDLKPANILLDEDGNAYLADFGIAKDLGKKISPFQTDQQAVVGSPAYIAPEQVKSDQISPQTDIYSLGVMLYEILTGQLPFQAPTPIALMFMHINEQVPAIRMIRPDLPDAVNAVIQRATAKSPADRYPDVLTMVQELRQALALGPGKTARLPELPRLPTSAPAPANGGERTTGATKTRSAYETGVLYLPTQLLTVEQAVENPYKGLRAFQEADAADFFGREVLTHTLLARLREPGPFGRFLAVVGPSGSGKSSVVRAGLIPALRRGALPGSENWFVLELFPGARPIDELAQALLRIAVDPPNNLIEPLTLDDEGLLRVVDQVVPGGDETEVVLVIDQFEELFTLVEDEAVSNHVLNTIIKAVTDPYSRVRVIITLRADFYDRPLLYPRFSELMRQRTEVVVPLAPEELKQAIVSPAERNGLAVAPELVDAILVDVSEQPGALPLLQYALTEVFERRSGRELTLTPYQASGGVLGALARRAEELYEDLPPAQHDAARQLFLRLVTLGEGVEDTRRRVRRSELIPAGADAHALDAVIDVYGQYRLLTLDRDPITRAPTVEVAHEALIRTWQRLRQWLDASRDDLRIQRRVASAAAEWATSGQERSFLASGARLAQFEQWGAETKLALNAEERAYLDASLAERDKRRALEAARQARESVLERQSRTFLRAMVGVFAVAALLALGLSVFAFQQRQVAVEQEQQAQQSAREVQDLALTEGAQSAYFQGNIDLARALALTAAEQPNPSALAEQVLASAAYNPGAQMVLRGHSDVVNSVVYSPDETMALSGGRNDKVAILWDLKSGSEIRRFAGHKGRIRQVAFLPDGKSFLTGGEDGTVRLWDVGCATPTAQECDTPIRVFVDHDGFEVKGIAVRPGSRQFMTASSDKSLRLWDVDCATPTAQECDTPIRSFDPANGGHTLEANQVAFSSDGKRALSSSEDATLVLWDVETGRAIRRLEHPDKEETRGVAFMPGDKQALSVGKNPDVIRWDLETGQVLDRLRGHRGTVYYVAVSPDGTRAISGADDNTVIVWNLEKGVAETVLRGHGGYIRQVEFSKDGRHAISGSADQTIRVWELHNGAEQQRLDSGAQVNGVALSADGQRIATASDNSVAQIWDAGSGTALATFPWHTLDVKAVAFSPDGKYLLSGAGKRDGSLVLTNLQTGQIERKFSFPVFGSNSIAFTPDGKRAVTGMIIPGGDDYADVPTLDPELKNISLILWDVATGSPIYKVTDILATEDRHDSINTVVITPDGKQIIAATGAGSKILILDLETGKQVKTLDLNDGARSSSIALTPDGKYLIAGGSDKTFIIWDMASGERIFNSPLQSAAVTAVALMGDGRYAASSTEGEVYVWDLQTGQKIRSFSGHRREVNQLVFTADGRTLVSASRDGTTRVWRIETLQQIVGWAKANRYKISLTCEQERQYNLPETSCQSGDPSASS
ncbi:MAG: protein kinase [Kouleothrix sp.]|nr:protein kinase [Kouleothrix sp.]